MRIDYAGMRLRDDTTTSTSSVFMLAHAVRKSCEFAQPISDKQDRPRAERRGSEEGSRPARPRLLMNLDHEEGEIVVLFRVADPGAHLV